jgi:hypothetical protein
MSAPIYKNDTLNERGRTHGDYAVTAEIAQVLKAVIEKYTEVQECDLSFMQRESLHLMCTKISRIISGSCNNIDHWRDLSAYASLISERLASQEGATDVRSVRMINVGGIWRDQ